MAAIPISSKVLLDAMLHKAGLPPATYSASPENGMVLRVTISFYPILGNKTGPTDKVSLSTSAHLQLEEAQDYVAATAIKYMEDYQGVVPQDYNYSKLKTLEEINASLARELNTVKHENRLLKQQMKETVNTNKLLNKGSDASLGAEQSFATNLKLQVNTRMSAQSTTGPSSLSVPKRRIYDGNMFGSAYHGYTHPHFDEDYHQDMDDDYANYVRSP